ncbi:TetR family transcriptional regulator [Streptomyces monticola]|uniref:TetR family transcriptional regulator n=1 Tax=Streptomyces monticola TaxID=2666263 RepID=A0ABW2JJQ6_9ACTN
MPPTAAPLTAERILEATEDVLRRHGPAKATVVDVARELGVSHGSVYRHFRTKAALREAVIKRWLGRTTETLAGVVEGTGPAPEKLRGWLAALFEAKRHKAGDDPQLFATYSVLVGETSDQVDQHIAILVGQLAVILEEGVRAGEFAPCDIAGRARAVLDATGRFHDPYYAGQWSRPGIDQDFTEVCDLVLRGLRP